MYSTTKEKYMKQKNILKYTTHWRISKVYEMQARDGFN